MNTTHRELWLENQICFPLYAVSRMVTKLYAPHLKELDITYPQYLVLLVLWQEDQRTVSEISELLFLESNTLTPLLKRMESKKLVQRQRSETDERKVLISLTKKGQALQDKAACVPQQIIGSFQSEVVKAEEVVQLRETLNKLMQLFGSAVAEDSAAAE